MADEKKNPLGPTGERVRGNVERLREARGMSKKDLADRSRELGRAIPPLGISRIEAGTRRVDADDLIVLALALNVSPLTLLLPPELGDTPVHLTETYPVTSGTAWSWAEGRQTAMDWEARPIASFDPSADPAISSELYEREQEFGRRNAEYMALAQPAERQRLAAHPAMRIVRTLSSVIADLVTPSLNLDRVHLSALSRMAKRRYDQLGYELEDIAEKLPPVHPGVAPTDERTAPWFGVMRQLQTEAGQNDESTAEDGGADE